MYFDGDRLVSYYAVSPVYLWINGDIMKAALSNMTMTAPDYQGKGLFPQLASSLFDNLRINNYKFVIGFPNENSHYGFINKLGWSDIDRIPMLCKENDDSIQLFGSQGKIPDFRCIDSSFDPNLVAINPIEREQIFREPSYLKWRLFNHPTKNYKGYYFPATNDFFVYKEYKNTKGLYIDIVDHECTCYDNLRAFLLLTSSRCIGWNIWVNPKTLKDFYLNLEKLGFRMREPITYFSYYSFASAQLDVDFSYRMSDSDVF
jgi:hypothetical protein